MKLILFIYFFIPLFLSSQTSNLAKTVWLKDSSRIDSMTFKDQVYKTLIYTPREYNSDSSKKWPLIIFLHGRSLTGNNLEKIKKYGVLYSLIRGRKVPSIVVAPQLSKGAWQPDSLDKFLEVVVSNLRIDTSRVSIVGMSLGAYGALHYTGKYPDKISACAAFCGGGNVNDAESLSKVPVWLAHGKKDASVPFIASDTVFNAIQKYDSISSVFTIFPDFGHSQLERLFHRDELYDFLLSNKKQNTFYFPNFDAEAFEAKVLNKKSTPNFVDLVNEKQQSNLEGKLITD
jgi:predicted peptidase